MRKWMMCLVLVGLLATVSGCAFLDDLQQQYEANDQNAHKERVLREGPNQHEDPNPRNLDEPWKVSEEDRAAAEREQKKEDANTSETKTAPSKSEDAAKEGGSATPKPTADQASKPSA